MHKGRCCGLSSGKSCWPTHREPKWLWRLWLCYPLPPLGVGLLEAWDLSSANFQQKIFWKPKSTNILASVHTSCFKHVGIANLITFGSQHLQSRFAILHHSASLFSRLPQGGICIFHSADSCSSRRVTLKKSCLEEARSIKSSTCSWSGYTNATVKILEAADDPSEKQGLWYVTDDGHYYHYYKTIIISISN